MGGRDQSERLVAINRNSWSRSSGARNPEEKTYLSITARAEVCRDPGKAAKI
jgi:hypothetical protein